MSNASVDFFESQFRRQVQEADFALNPFERRALPYLCGRVLDLGCGLGNLALEAARRGCAVHALDASPTAIEHVADAARVDGLAVEAQVADLSAYRIARDYDVIVAIGLLMFFDRARALGLLDDIADHVAPGGCAIVNVLTEGTTYRAMFDPRHHYLFPRDALRQRFAAWELLEDVREDFAAPAGQVKSFATLIARRP